ncbi:MAG TPA: lipase maturation factor family protein [Polyangia bacterium]|nr:lipase maturation factor family protein [Polyangia bacterium]
MKDWRAWFGPWRRGSGPAVASLFHRLFALISLAAWWSLGSQVRVLIGSRGLLPAAEFMDAVRAAGVSPFEVPTLFWRFHADAVLVGGTWVGAALSIAALAGWRPRLCFGVSTALYLSYATVARMLLSFQWDNLLLECGLLATFLPRNRPAPLVHFLFRMVLFKLYFESGLAKWQSPIHDWQDGSAMTYYYETAPLPTVLGVFAHHLPVWWHHLESRAVLVLELIVPLFIFGPRRLRLAAAIVFGFFQIFNAATANYGFFCYLAAVLNVFLLDDTDLHRWIRIPPTEGGGARGGQKTLLWLARAATALWLLVSLIDALVQFTEPGRGLSLVAPLFELNQRFRLVNSYHLFASITRQRIEPQFETADEDGPWIERDLRYKAGDPRRAPGFVAPHQPRIDFQLWFYGLAFQRREPPYVSTLVEKLCNDPAAVQPLFRDSLSPHPTAVRIAYWQYQFASASERHASGDWWRRARIAESRAISCAGLRP